MYELESHSTSLFSHRSTTVLTMLFGPSNDVMSHRPLNLSHPLPSPYDNSDAFIPPPMPDHWKCKFAYPRPIAILMELGFTGLCLLSFGSSDLDELWSIMSRAEQDKELFTAYKDRVSSRVSVITIVVSDNATAVPDFSVEILVKAGLILSTTAAFATTDPPRPGLLDYTQTGAYLCILSSLGIIVGGVIVGSISIFVMMQCTARWCMRVSEYLSHMYFSGPTDLI